MSRSPFSQRDVVAVLALVAVVGWSVWRSAEIQEKNEVIQQLELKLKRAERNNRQLMEHANHALAGQREWSLYWKTDAEEVRALAEKAGVKVPNYKATPGHGAFPVETKE